MSLILVVTIGGRRVALEAAKVDSVIELDALSPVPCAPPHIAGLSALRSRVLTVIDCRRALGLGDTDFAALNVCEAAVTEVEGHPYALTVDSVEDVMEIDERRSEVRADLGKGWERAGLGMVETPDGPLLLVDIGKLIEGPGDERAAA